MPGSQRKSTQQNEVLGGKDGAEASPSQAPELNMECTSPIIGPNRHLVKEKSAISMSFNLALSRLTEHASSSAVTAYQDEEFYHVLEEEVSRLTGEFGDKFDDEAVQDMGGLPGVRRAKSVPHLVRFDPDIDDLILSLEGLKGEGMPSFSHNLGKKPQAARN